METHMMHLSTLHQKTSKWNVQGVTPVQEKDNVIYHFKCHRDSDYVGRTSQRFHIRKDRHVSKSLIKWLLDGSKKKEEAVLQLILDDLLSTLFIRLTIVSLC